MNETLPDIPDDSSNSELLPVKAVAAPVVAPAAAATPQQMRVMEVSEALAPAYQRASTLEMTDEEIAALMAPFPDSAVEIRPHDGLIYLPHICISNRLNKVFKPGKWSLMRRREWFDSDSSTMYGEYVLLIRGCFVGESVGGHPYIARNPKTNYSDVLESTAAEALRRIAGKRLSCGSQCWEPEYARQWIAKYAQQIGGKWSRKADAFKTTPTTTQPAPARPEPKSAPRALSLEAWLRECKVRLLKAFSPPAIAPHAWRYGVQQGWIMDNESLANANPAKMFSSVDYAKSVEENKEAVRQDFEAISLAIDQLASAEPDLQWQMKYNLLTETKRAHAATEIPNTDGPGQQPDAGLPEGAETVTGEVQQISVKDGTNAKGRPWKRYGVKVGGIWYNTFDTKLGAIAEAAKGSEVTLVYKAQDKGNDLLEIRL